MVARNRDITKRMNYFDRQFLRAQDFVDEQDYHLDRRCRHNRLLHTYGIAEGLIVTASPEPGEEKMVLVSPGTAYDPQGSEIILTVTPPATARKVDLSEVEVDPGPPISYSSPLYLTIAYGEKNSDPSTDSGIEGFTRIQEKPQLKPSAEEPLDPNELLLAVIERDTSSGNVTEVDTNPLGRRQAEELPPNSIGPAELRDGAVQSRHIALAESGTDQDTTTGTGVKTDHLKDGAVTDSKLADEAVSTRSIQDGAVNNTKIADNTINLSKFDTETQRKIGVEGWVRLPFLPHSLFNTNEFIRDSVESRSDMDGAGGLIPIPVPAGISQVTGFRIAGPELQSQLLFVLFRLSAGQESTPAEALILDGIIQPSTDPTVVMFDEILFPLDEVIIDEMNDTLSLGVLAFGISRINFIAVQFE